MKRPGVIARAAFRWLFILAISFLVVSIVAVFSLRWIDPLTTSFILRDRASAWWDNDKNYHFEHEWVDFAHIAIPMKVAVMASEDQKFPDHHGFDFDSMQKAWDQNQRGRKVKGASTITQQVAKNLFLWSGRSLFRKGIEAWFTLLLETFCSKQRILEIYLNSAEFGKGVFGVEAASQRFFHKSAARLNSSEAALLAAVLPAPKRFQVNKPSSYLRGRQGWIETQMSQVDTNGLFDP
ncbi:MAG TPA: monofunctional biosynthetic peptidoglycan transglycosylase [Steroidobacteraceae bacterium]|nr:monofunctional biosynthetic peptidoglycan transglycosylase [Steroidobacteraceae bacterium]